MPASSNKRQRKPVRVKTIVKNGTTYRVFIYAKKRGKNGTVR